MKSLFITFLCLAACLELGLSESRFVGTVRQIPSNFRRCSTFLVSTRFVLATAACFVCDQNCTFEVAFNERVPAPTGTEELYKVEYVVMHPKYYTHKYLYNIAVAKLDRSPHAIIGRPVNDSIFTLGFVALWSLNADLSKFSLYRHEFARVPNQICEKNTGLKIREDEFCASTSNVVSMGPYNEGVPFYKRYDPFTEYSRFRSALGFRARSENEVLPGNFFIFTSIPYYFDWIMSVINLQN